MELIEKQIENAKRAWHDAAMKKAGLVQVLDPDEIIDVIASSLQKHRFDFEGDHHLWDNDESCYWIRERDADPLRVQYKTALKSIANIWPIETTARIADVAGIKDDRSRAIIAEAAVSIARKALGIEKMP